MRKLTMAAAVLAGLLPLGAHGQTLDYMISAEDPENMALAMRSAGYEAELDVDGIGDPMILTEFDGWAGNVMFYGCDAETNSDCDSVMLRVGLDRKEPMPGKLLDSIIASERFVAIYRDVEGDPILTWDIVTLDGIPMPVFTRSLDLFSEQVNRVAERVFAEEREVEDGGKA